MEPSPSPYSTSHYGGNFIDYEKGRGALVPYIPRPARSNTAVGIRGKNAPLSRSVIFVSGKYPERSKSWQNSPRDPRPYLSAVCRTYPYSAPGKALISNVLQHRGFQRCAPKDKDCGRSSRLFFSARSFFDPAGDEQA